MSCRCNSSSSSSSSSSMSSSISSSRSSSSSSSSSSSRMSGLVGTVYCNYTQCKKGKLNMGICLFLCSLWDSMSRLYWVKRRGDTTDLLEEGPASGISNSNFEFSNIANANTYYKVMTLNAKMENYIWVYVSSNVVKMKVGLVCVESKGEEVIV